MVLLFLFKAWYYDIIFIALVGFNFKKATLKTRSVRFTSSSESIEQFK